jgi:hypothetical protein
MKLCQLCKRDATCRMVLASGETVLACDQCVAEARQRDAPKLCTVCHKAPVASGDGVEHCDAQACIAAASKQRSLRSRQQQTKRAASFHAKVHSPLQHAASASAVPAMAHGEAQRLLALRRDSKARLHVVNADLVASSAQPARQRELLDERTRLMAVIETCDTVLNAADDISSSSSSSSSLASSQNAPLASPRASGAAAAHEAPPATPRGTVVPAGTTCVYCATSKIAGRVKADDGSSMWFCRACLLQVSKCARCGKVGKNLGSASIAGVDGVVCNECIATLKTAKRAARHTVSNVAAAGSAAPPNPMTRSPSRTTATTAAAATTTTSALASSPSRQSVTPSRLALPSGGDATPRDAVPAPVTSRSAPRRLAASEPPPATGLERAKSSSSASAIKFDASIWGTRGAPWLAFQAPMPRRTLFSLLPPSAAPMSRDDCECCYACGSAYVAHRIEGERRGVAGVCSLCTSCHIALVSRLARGE